MCHKFFEMTNHLGNVLVTISDKKIMTFADTGVDNGNCEAGTGVDTLDVNTVGAPTSYVASMKVSLLPGFGRIADATGYVVVITCMS